MSEFQSMVVSREGDYVEIALETGRTLQLPEDNAVQLALLLLKHAGAMVAIRADMGMATVAHASLGLAAPPKRGETIN